MKTALVFLLVLLMHRPLYAQQDKAVQYGLDTALVACNTCKPGKVYEYFSIGGKYPESSMSLLQRVNAWVKTTNIQMGHSGFITFRFTVNNDGVVSAYHLYLLDSLYHPQEFSSELIAALYAFVRDLKQWKTNLNGRSGPAYYYNYYLSFQVKNGKIISVAP